MKSRYYEFDSAYQTTLPPASSDPTDAGDLVNLGYAEGHFARGVADLTALSGIAANRRSDKLPVFVVAEKVWYVFDSASSATADALNVVQPSSGTGRWIRTKTKTSFTMANNQSSPANVTGLSLDVSKARGALYWVVVKRQHTARKSMSGFISIDYDGVTCNISAGPFSNFSGVDFSVTAAGQVQYTSDNMAGTLVVSDISWKLLEIMEAA